MHCTKSKYASQQFALDDIARIKAKSTRAKIPVAAYLCKCGFWHLSSQPNKDVIIEELRAIIKQQKIDIGLLIEGQKLQGKVIQQLKSNSDKEIRADERIALLRQQIADLNKKNKRLSLDNNDLIAKLNSRTP